MPEILNNIARAFKARFTKVPAAERGDRARDTLDINETNPAKEKNYNLTALNGSHPDSLFVPEESVSDMLVHGKERTPRSLTPLQIEAAQAVVKMVEAELERFRDTSKKETQTQRELMAQQAKQAGMGTEADTSDDFYEGTHDHFGEFADIVGNIGVEGIAKIPYRNSLSMRLTHLTSTADTDIRVSMLTYDTNPPDNLLNDPAPIVLEQGYISARGPDGHINPLGKLSKIHEFAKGDVVDG